MLNKLRYLIGFLLLLSLAPARGFSQSADDAADKAERAHRKHVVKHAVDKTKSGVKRTYHKAARTAMRPIDKAKAKHRADEKSVGETK